MAGQGLGSPVQTEHGHLPPNNIMDFLNVSSGEKRQEEGKHPQKPPLPLASVCPLVPGLLAPQKLILSAYWKVNSGQGGLRAMISWANEAVIKGSNLGRQPCSSCFHGAAPLPASQQLHTLPITSDRCASGYSGRHSCVYRENF